MSFSVSIPEVIVILFFSDFSASLLILSSLYHLSFCVSCFWGSIGGSRKILSSGDGIGNGKTIGLFIFSGIGDKVCITSLSFSVIFLLTKNFTVIYGNLIKLLILFSSSLLSSNDKLKPPIPISPIPAELKAEPNVSNR